MTLKRVLCPERLRQIPAQFSWVDHRLVRERYIERCDPPAMAYLFLVTVGEDAVVVSVEGLLTQVVPEMLNRIEFGRVRRQFE